MENKITCPGCIEEMVECYEWQSGGFDAGLEWVGDYNPCCFVFVLDEKGGFIVS